MTRRLTTRERVLLLLLSILLLSFGYYKLVVYPVSETIAQAQIKQDEAEIQLIVEQTKAIKLKQMRDELEAIGMDAGMTRIADFDNMQNVVRLLNSALISAQQYNLTFQNVSLEGHIARRTISMTFTCESYATAKGIVQALYAAPYRCEISMVSLQAIDSDGKFLPEGDITAYPVAANMTITFLEYVENPPGNETK